MSVNKVLLIGNLGRDPEVRYLPSGNPVANFSIATSENYTDRNGAKQERTDWHNIVVYGTEIPAMPAMPMPTMPMPTHTTPMMPTAG